MGINRNKSPYAYMEWLHMVNTMYAFLHTPVSNAQYDLYKSVLNSMVKSWIDNYQPKGNEGQLWWELEDHATNGICHQSLKNLH